MRQFFARSVSNFGACHAVVFRSMGYAFAIPRCLRAEFGDSLLEIDFREPSVAVSDDFVRIGSPSRRTIFTYDVRTGESTL